jgi:hypothetical protein
MQIHLTTLDRYMPGAHPDRPYRIRQLFGGILSLVFYVIATIIVVVVGVNNQFGNIKFVDQEAERKYRVAWIESGKKLVYPPGFFAPVNTRSLSQLSTEEEQKAKRKQQREHRRALADAKKREAQEANKVANNSEDKKSNGGDVAANNASDPLQPPKPADPKPPVAINVAPLREHIDEAVDRYRKGKLKINANSLHGTISVGMNSNGDFGEVKTVTSSGSRDADEMAKAFLKELLDQPGVKPFLSSFTLIKISVDATSSDVSIGVVGDTNSTLNATNVATALKFAMAIKKGNAAPDSNTAIVLNNVKVLQSGNQVHATISLPRDTASNVMKGFGIKTPAS